MKSDQKHQLLHCHTTVSDGNLSYNEILEFSSKNNISVVAFTDHDSLPNKNIMNFLESSRFKSNWIIGIEISTSGPHIVGLFVDPFNKNLITYCTKAQGARISRMEKTVDNLRKLDFDISVKECLEASLGESVGRPHIVKALKSKNSNLEIIEKLRRKMESESKKNQEIKTKYDEMMRRGENQYPYVLFLGDDSFIPGVYVDYIYRLSLDEAVKLIRNAGGLAIFAHWFTEKEKMPKEVIESLLKEDRIDGMEVVYGLGDLTEEDLENQRKILIPMLRKYQKLESGGADIHNLEDLQLFCKSDWYATLTNNLVDQMLLCNKRVDTKWSSFKEG